MSDWYVINAILHVRTKIALSASFQILVCTEGEGEVWIQ